jgi:hypothetical protein
MKFSKLYLFVLLAGLFAVSCEDDDSTDPVDPTPTTAELSINVDHMFGTEAFELDKTFDLGNSKVKFSTAQFYISGINLMDDDQNVTPFDGEVLLITPDVDHQHVGDIGVEHFHMVSFNIGIDSATNANTQPTDYAAGHPLAPQVNNMWWTWAAGYIFYKFEGEVDIDGDGTFDDTFAYHIGTDGNLLSKQEMLHHTVTAGGELEVEMVVDYSKIFDNIDLTTELKAHMNPMNVVAKIATNTNAAIDFK